MSSVLPYQLTVTVPSHLMSKAEVDSAIGLLTRQHGGVTIVGGRGMWADDDGEFVVEPVQVLTWWSVTEPDPTNLCIMLLRAGEKAVLYERGPYGARIVTRDDYPGYFS